MSTKGDTSWMPSHGSYRVDVGSSLSGALKASKGLPQAPKLSDRGFYSFRYNFKPESIDLYKPGTIEVKREGDRKTATIERASTVPGEGQLFTGTESAAKDVDCVLLYDEEAGTFILEKLDSLINVTWGGKSTMPSNRPSESSSLATPSAPPPPAKNDDLDLTAELERELLSVVDDAPPKRSSTKQEPSSLKVPTLSTPNGASGSQSLQKKSMIKHRPKPKPKEPAQLFMNPNSAAARVANKRSAPTKQEPKPEQKSPVSSQPVPASKPTKLVGDVKGKGVKREQPESEVEESAKVQKRPKPSPPLAKTQLQSKLQTRPQAPKPPPPTARLPQKPQFTAVPSQPQPKPQPPVKKGFNLELPTGSSSGPSSNPLLAGGGGGISLSLPTGSPTLGSTQPPPPAPADPNPQELSDSESDWDEVDADGPSPLSHQTQPQSEPQPFRLGSLTIEEDPPAGFNAKLDIVDGDDDDPYGDDRDGDGEGEDIDMDNLMAEMAEELQGGDGGGEQEGEGDLNDLNEMEDFLIAAVSDQDQEGYQDGDVDNYGGGDLYGDDDSSSSSEDSDD